MVLYESVWHLISALLVLILSLLISLNLKKTLCCTHKRIIFLFFWHLLFCATYLVYLNSNAGDAFHYYNASFSSEVSFSFGTRGVIFFTSILTQIFGLSFLGCFLVFQFIGFLGLLFLDASLRTATINNPPKVKLLSSLIVLLPSVSFWSAAIGKDAISFMAVGLALWASLNLNKRIFLMVFSILLMLMVRPHMSGLLVMGLAASFVFQKGIPLIYRLLLGTISFSVVAVLIPFALNYAGVGENVDVEQLEQYINKREGYNTEGGGGVDLSSMSLPMKLFTYMFRPLPFEAHSIASFMASLDNIVLLYLFIVGSYYLVKTRLTPELMLHNRVFMWTYLLGSWCILAMTSANLGIAMRQKWMIAPMLIFLLISVIGKKNSSNYEN